MSSYREVQKPPTREAEVSRRIAVARALLEPSEVRPNRVPGWLRRRIMVTINVGRDNKAGFCALTVGIKAACANSGWLDHWGTTPWTAGCTAFVAEPYLSMEDLQQAQLFADFFSLHLTIHPNSWWYPGWTTRLVFLPKELPR